jgi:hypothetical protein
MTAADAPRADRLGRPKARTAELVWTTGARVQRYDWFNDEPYFEELSLAPKAVRLGA